jgi:RNase P subunit RPR2
MSSTRKSGGPQWTSDRREECDDCEAETPHEITVEVRSEGNSPAARGPYRVSKCLECGLSSEVRMYDV